VVVLAALGTRQPHAACRERDSQHVIRRRISKFSGFEISAFSRAMSRRGCAAVLAQVRGDGRRRPPASQPSAAAAPEIGIGGPPSRYERVAT